MKSVSYELVFWPLSCFITFVIQGCPNSYCKYYQKTDQVQRDGSFFRANDSRVVQRYRCKCCGKRFSKSTNTLEYNQKKRRVNHLLMMLLCSGNSIRRCAMILDINKNTVLNKIVYLAKKARLENHDFLEQLKQTPVTQMQFDDLITSEHTKMKPLSITIAVNSANREILGMRVSKIPAFGLLAKKSRKKYGYRKSSHMQEAHRLFESIKDSVSCDALVESDEHKRYPELVRKYFPRSNYKRFKGKRGAVVGQGELKKAKYDPLFAINHTCATLRADINRLIRKTWCTTKKVEMLQNHLDIFMHFYNTIYLPKVVNTAAI